MTRDQALQLVATEWWEGKSAYDICLFQLFEERLCMPFDVFHKAVEDALGRPVWTHEFGSAGIVGLQKELLGQRAAPTFEEICELIPEAKRIVVVASPEEKGA
jgi:hypothetical protein